MDKLTTTTALITELRNLTNKINYNKNFTIKSILIKTRQALHANAQFSTGYTRLNLVLVQAIVTLVTFYASY
jgi:hypothetical protein